MGKYPLAVENSAILRVSMSGAFFTGAIGWLMVAVTIAASGGSRLWAVRCVWIAFLFAAVATFLWCRLRPAVGRAALQTTNP